LGVASAGLAPITAPEGYPANRFAEDVGQALSPANRALDQTRLAGGSACPTLLVFTIHVPGRARVIEMCGRVR